MGRECGNEQAPAAILGPSLRLSGANRRVGSHDLHSFGTLPRTASPGIHPLPSARDTMIHQAVPVPQLTQEEDKNPLDLSAPKEE